MNAATRVTGNNGTVAIALRPGRQSAIAFAEARSPLGFRGGLSNLSDYIGDDPTNATDPSGLVVVLPIGAQPPTPLQSAAFTNPYAPYFPAPTNPYLAYLKNEIKSITVTDVGDKLGIYADTDSLGWAFTVKVETTGDIAKLSVEQSVSTLEIWFDPDGKYWSAKVFNHDNDDPDKLPLQKFDEKTANKLKKDIQSGRETFAPDKHPQVPTNDIVILVKKA